MINQVLIGCKQQVHGFLIVDCKHLTQVECLKTFTIKCWEFEICNKFMKLEIQ